MSYEDRKGGRAWLFENILSIKIQKMSIIFFGSKFDFVAIKNDAHFLKNDNFWVRGGGGRIENCLDKTKNEHNFFAPTPYPIINF